MDSFEDFVEPEVGIAIAVTAVVASPKVRKVLRRSAVYGLAGLMKARDVVVSTARGVAQSAKDAAASLTSDNHAAEAEAPTARKKGRTAAAHE